MVSREWSFRLVILALDIYASLVTADLARRHVDNTLVPDLCAWRQLYRKR